VDERIIPEFEDAREQFRGEVQYRRVMEAESTYVADLLEVAEVEMQEGWYDQVVPIASNPTMGLTRRAADRPIADYAGGAYTLGEYQQWVQEQPPQIQAQLETAPESQYDVLMQNLIRSELLLNAAVDEGIEVPQARLDSIASAIREGVAEVAQSLGFFDLVPEGEETQEEMIQRVVMDLVVQIVQRGQQVYPVGGFSLALREQYGAEVFDTGAEMAVARVTELRNQAPPAPPRAQLSDPVDTTAAPDTATSGG
jgi:hypothetical protein